MGQLFTNWENDPRCPLFVVRTSLDSDQFHQILQLTLISRLPTPRFVLGSIGCHPLLRLFPAGLSALLLHHRSSSFSCCPLGLLHRHLLKLKLICLK
eukprot:sb/3479097/